MYIHVIYIYVCVCVCVCVCMYDVAQPHACTIISNQLAFFVGLIIRIFIIYEYKYIS